MNLYGYVVVSPLGFTDPFGLDAYLGLRGSDWVEGAEVVIVHPNGDKEDIGKLLMRDGLWHIGMDNQTAVDFGFANRYVGKEDPDAGEFREWWRNQNGYQLQQYRNHVDTARELFAAYQYCQECPNDKGCGDEAFREGLLKRAVHEMAQAQQIISKMLGETQAKREEIEREIARMISVVRLIPGGEPSYQISEGNYGRAALAFGIDVLGMATGGYVGGKVFAATGSKLLSAGGGMVTNAAIRGVGHGAPRGITGD